MPIDWGQIQKLGQEKLTGKKAAAVPEKEPGPISLFGRGLAHGGLTFAESIGSGVQWMGNRLRSDDIAQAGEGWAEYWREKADAYGPPPELEGKNVIDNPELLGKASFWIYNVADMIPSLATTLVPAFGWMKGVKAVGVAKGFLQVLADGKVVPTSIEAGKFINRLSRLGSWVVGGATGGSLEAAQTYKTLLDQGVDETEAARSAEMMFLMAGALNAIGTGSILEKAGKTFIGKVAKHAGAAVAEGLTEGAEEPAEVLSKYIGKYLSGEPIPDNLKSDLLDSLKDAATVAPIAALTGGGASMITSRKSQSDEMGDRDAQVRKIIDAAKQGKKNVDQSIGQEAPDTGTPQIPKNPLPVDEGLIERVPVTEEPTQEPPTAGAGAVPIQPTPAPTPGVAPEGEGGAAAEVPTLPSLDEYWTLTPKQMAERSGALEDFVNGHGDTATKEAKKLGKELLALKGEDEATKAKRTELKKRIAGLSDFGVQLRTRAAESSDTLFNQVQSAVMGQIEGTPEQKQAAWEAFRTEWKKQPDKPLGEILKGVAVSKEGTRRLSYQNGRVQIEILPSYNVGGKPQQEFKINGRSVIGIAEFKKEFPEAYEKTVEKYPEFQSEGKTTKKPIKEETPSEPVETEAKAETVLKGKESWEMSVEFNKESKTGNAHPWRISAKDTNGNEVGYALISDMGNKQYLVNTVFVNEGNRRQGVNGALVEKANSEIKAFDGGKLFFNKREATPSGLAFIENLEKKGLLGENKRIKDHGMVSEYKGKVPTESFQDKLKSGAKALTGAKKKKGKAKPEPTTIETPIENPPIDLQILALQKAKKQGKAKGIKFELLGPESVVHTPAAYLTKKYKKLYPDGVHIRITKEGYEAYTEQRKKKAEQAKKAGEAPRKTYRSFIHSIGGLAPDDPVYGQLIKDRLMVKKGWQPGSFKARAKGGNTLSEAFEKFQQRYPVEADQIGDEANLISILEQNPLLPGQAQTTEEDLVEQENKRVTKEGYSQDENILDAGALLFGSKTVEEARAALEKKYGKEWYWNKQFAQDIARAADDEKAQLRAEARPKLEAYLRREDYKEGDIPRLIDEIFANEAKFNETLAEIEAYEKQAKEEPGEVPFEEKPLGPFDFDNPEDRAALKKLGYTDAQIEEGRRRGEESFKVKPGEKYPVKPSPAAIVTDPTPLFRSVSPAEMDDIIEKGLIVGGLNKFNSFDRRRQVFFGEKINDQLIGQGEEIDRQAERNVLSTEIGSRLFDDYDKVSDKIRELSIKIDDEPDNLKRAPLRKELQKLQAEAFNLRQSYGEETKKEKKRISDKLKEAKYTSYILETKPLTGGIRYTDRASGMGENPEVGMASGVVKAGDIVAVHKVKNGKVIETTKIIDGDLSGVKEPPKSPAKALTGAKGKKEYPEGYYDAKQGKFIRVAPGPFENWTFYKTSDLNKTGTRVVTKGDHFFKTKEEAKQALAEYAANNGHDAMSMVDFKALKDKEEAQKPSAEKPLFRPKEEEPKPETPKKRFPKSYFEPLFKDGTIPRLAKQRREGFEEKLGQPLTDKQVEDLMVEMMQLQVERGEPALIIDSTPAQPDWLIEKAWNNVKPAEEKKAEEPEPSELQELRKQVLVLQNEPMRIVSKMFKTPAAIAQMTGEERKEAQKKFDRMVAVETKRLQPEIDKLQAKIDEILAKPEPETQRLFGEEATGKPAWQMTKAEYAAAFPKANIREHRMAVVKAQEEGETIPDNVLDDYPDLKPKEPPQKGLFGKPTKEKKSDFDFADELDDLIEEEAPAKEEAPEKPRGPGDNLNTKDERTNFAERLLNNEDASYIYNTLGKMGIRSKTTEKLWEDARIQKDPNKDYGEAFYLAAEKDLFRWVDQAKPGRREMAEITPDERNYQEVAKALDARFKESGTTIEKFIEGIGAKISPRVAPYFERWANEKTGQNAGDLQPAGGRVETPAGGTGEATLGGARRADLSGRLRIPEPSLLPRPGRYVDDGRFSILRGDQRFAANLAVQGWKDGKQANLNASGVGSGKTLTGIAVADTISRLASEDPKLKAEGRTKVLIVVPSKPVLDTRWIPDASEKAGVNLRDTSKFELGTVHDMRTGKIGKGKYAAIILDESQMYGDPESQRTVAQEKIDAPFRYYMSATPGDQPFKFSLFMSKITGATPEAIQKALGVNVEWYEDLADNKELKMRCTLLQGSTWHEVKANVIKYRNEAMRQGNLFRSWYVPDVELKEDILDWNTAQEEEQHQIDGYWLDAIARAGSPMKKKNLGRLRIGELRRSIETYKVRPIYDAAMRAIAEGKHVVVVFKGYNKTLIRALGIEKGQYGGFGQMFEAILKREGAVKEWAKIYGQRDKSEEIRKFQSGEVKLALMTPESGGMGIDLDDKFGNSPREVLIANVDYSGEVFEQVLGRIYRGPTTKSRSEIRFFNYRDSIADNRAWKIVGDKVGAVKAVQHGYDLDALQLDIPDERGKNKTIFFYNNQDSLLAGQPSETFSSKIERFKEEIETDKIPAINDIEKQLVGLMEGNKMPMISLNKEKTESLSNLLKLSVISQEMKAGKKPISAYIEQPAKGVYQFRRPYGWFVYREGGIVEVKDRREMAETGKEQRTPDAMLQLIASLQRPGQPRELVSIKDLRSKAITWPYDEFDQTLLQLARDGKVALHHHDFASSLTEAERKMLLSVEDAMAHWGGRTYFVGVVPKTEVKPVAKPQVTVIKMSDHPELKKAIDVGGGVMVTTALKDPTADAKAKEIVNANKDLLSAFGNVIRKLKGLLEASGFKDIPDVFITVDGNVRGYVPDDQRSDTPAFLNPFVLTQYIEDSTFYKNNAKRMGENRLRANGLMQAFIHEYAEYLTRNSPTVHGDDLIRMQYEIAAMIDPAQYNLIHKAISEEFYGKYLSRIQSVGKSLSDLAIKGSKLFGPGFPGSARRRNLAEAATANRGNREQALIRGGTFDSGIVEALPDSIYNKAMVDELLYRQAGKALSEDLQENRTFIMRLFQMIAPATEGAKSAHRQLQVELQSLAGPKSKRKFYFGIGYQPKFKRSEQSDLLDDAIRVWIDSGGEQAQPVFDAFKDAAARQLGDPEQYLKDKGITDKDPLKRSEAIKQNQREIRHWLKVIDMAEKLTPQQKEFAQKMVDLFEDAGMVAKEHGYLKSFVDNYVRRIYKFKPWEADAVKGTGGHGFRLRFGPNQQRSYKFMLEAILDGYQVGVKGVTNSWLSYMEELAQVIGDNAFKKLGMKTVDMSGNKLFTTKERTGWAPMNGMYVWEWAGDVVAEKELEGDEVLTIDDYGKKFFATTPTEIPEYWAVYKSEDASRASKKFLVKDEAMEWARSKGYTRIERRRPMERAELFEKRQVLAPAPLAEMFNKVTAKEQLFFKAPVLNYLLRWNAGVKTWVLMSSFFHHMAGARSWLFAIHHGWKPENLNLISAYKRGLDKIGERDPLLMFGIKNGLMLGVEGEYQERILQGQKGITEAIVSKLGLDKAQNVVEGFKRKRENWTNSLFKSFFSGLTAEAFCIEYTHELNRLNNLYNLGKLKEAPDPDRVAERVARLINYDFGGLPYQRMGRNPTMQKLARLALLAPDWCSLGDTRALTKTGWKYYYELETGDEIAAFDPKTNKMKWSVMHDKYVNESYAGPIVKINNHNRAIMVTPSHTCYAYNISKEKYEIIEAQKLNTAHRIPRAAPFDMPTVEVYSDLFVKLVGWLVTDGYVKSTKQIRSNGQQKEYRYGKITQSKPATVELLKNLGLIYHVDRKTWDHGKFKANYQKHVFTIPKPIFRQMESLGLDGKINWEFLSKLTERQLRLLYDTMMLANGTGQKRLSGPEHKVFYGVMILTMLGEPVTFYQQEAKCWRCRNISESKKFITVAKGTETVQFNGTIWCPSVETGFWLAERAGLVFITGNTESNFRIVTGMVPGLNTAINKLIGDLPEVPGMEKMSRQFFARSMVRIAIMTILAQMLLNGSDDSEEFIEEQMLSNRWNRFRWTELEITKLYNMLGIDTEEQRKTFSIGGHFFDPLKLVDPFKLAKGKGSPLTRVIEAVASGSDWAEKPYTGVKELVTTGKTTKKSYHQPLESGLDRLPSVVVNQIVNMQPIQLGHLIKYMQGEEDALSALMSSAGAAVHTAWAPRVETPIAPAKSGNDAALKTIEELQSNGILKAAPPSRYVSINSKSYQMSPKQYKEFFEKSSDMARPRLERLVESENFQKMSGDKKAQIIEKIIGNARRKARLKVKRDMIQQIREGILKEAA